MLAVNPAAQAHIQPTSSPKAVLAGIKRMFTTCPWWDVSYLVAVFFTVGCLIFIACGLFAWLPIAFPATTFSDETTIASGWTAFIGATLFQIGAVLLVFEACNENRTGCFGWALERAFSGTDEAIQAHGALNRCHHHHQRAKTKQPSAEESDDRRWQWWPSWHDLRTHYIHEIGWLASISLAIGATIFYVSGILALPYIYPHLSKGVLLGVYWLTYLVGGVLFVFSSALYMLEVQTKWYKPAPQLLGWHIGLWNMIGSVGWTLAAALGYCTESWCEYQSELSLIWASVAFTIGSALLWYEAVNKYTVEADHRIDMAPLRDEGDK